MKESENIAHVDIADDAAQKHVCGCPGILSGNNEGGNVGGNLFADRSKSLTCEELHPLGIVLRNLTEHEMGKDGPLRKTISRPCPALGEWNWQGKRRRPGSAGIRDSLSAK